MKPENRHTCIIACSTFELQLQDALDKMNLRIPVKYLEAGLHLRPNLLQEKLRQEVRRAFSNGADTKIVFGCCCPEIDRICNQYGGRRIDAENCYQLFLGKRYFKLLGDAPGTYFLDRFLAGRFEELVVKELGIDRHPKLKSLLFRNYTRIVYVDTSGEGLTTDACEVAEYLDLPIEVATGDPNRLATALGKIM